MAKSTHISRSLKLYLDGKEVVKTVKGLKTELRKSTETLNKAEIGSNAYRMALEKVGTLKSMLIVLFRRLFLGRNLQKTGFLFSYFGKSL